MLSQLAAVFWGLASAAAWGAGDFSGGLATRRKDAFVVVILSQTVGVVFLIIMACLFMEPFSETMDWIYGGLAGTFGAIGMLALYRGLADRQMGVVAPVAAVVTAAIPVLFAAFFEGLPGLGQLLGFGFALLAIWLVSGSGQTKFRLRELDLPLIAGAGFGLFLILIDRVHPGAVFWPLVSARLASIISLLLVAILLRRRFSALSGKLWILIPLAGIFDTGGNVFYALAAQAGRLDIAAVLASLYPVTTVLLARVILKESVAIKQWFSILFAFIAIVLIAS
jgi:uncharacterized membrane protein